MTVQSKSKSVCSRVTSPCCIHSHALNNCMCDVQARVEALGGQILFWNGVRVMGVLAVSRAIGDHCLRPFVIAQPEVRPLLKPVLVCTASYSPAFGS